MQTILHRAATRGAADHGWLQSNHSFSFANYYNPERMGFGVLRVLNDDHVAPGRGFDTHQHRDMEIISIPLQGDLEHKDSMGNTTVIRQGDIQVMSAGTGVAHSEYNKNKDEAVKFLQIWVHPRAKGLEPRYDQIALDEAAMDGKFAQVLSPHPEQEGVWINQDAYFSIGRFTAGQTADYRVKKAGNGLYVFVLEGRATVAGQELDTRDAVGITGTDAISLTSTSSARILLMEVPMEVN